MNVNELAKWLEENDASMECQNEAATMLRQLQAENEALKIKHDAIACSSCPCGLFVGGKMKQEPVAWMLKDESWNDFCRYSSYPTDGAIPLYTSPQYRELSDDEIKNFVARFFGLFPRGNPNEEYPISQIKLCEFAKDLLKKASEK